MENRDEIKGIKLLPDVISGRGDVKGFTFRKVKESPAAYIYEQVYNETNQVFCYEVFERKINKVFMCEKYPKSEAFGLWAYSCSTIEAAEVCFQMIEYRVANRS